MTARVAWPERTSLERMTSAQLWLWVMRTRMSRQPNQEHVSDFVTTLQGAFVWFNPDEERPHARLPHRVDVLRYNAFMCDPIIRQTRALLQSVPEPEDAGVLADKLMARGHWLGEPLALWLKGTRQFRRLARGLFRERAPDLPIFQGWRRCDQQAAERREVERVESNRATWERLRNASLSSTITPLVDGTLSITTGNESPRVVRFSSDDRFVSLSSLQIEQLAGLRTKRVGDSLVVLPALVEQRS